MTLEQLAALAASGESETLEFKETTRTRREAAKTVCAFPNQNGGQVLFSVSQAGVRVGNAYEAYSVLFWLILAYPGLSLSPVRFLKVPMK